MPEDQLSDPNLNAIFQEIKTVRKWCDKHDGQGAGTTHQLLNKRQGRSEDRVSKVENRIYIVGLLGVGAGYIVGKWKDIFGG